MSDENVTQSTPEENSATNPSTEASQNNVPYERFQEINNIKNGYANRIGKLEAQIDKQNQASKAQQDAKMVEDGKLKEALDLVKQERDKYKKDSDAWVSYQSDKRDNLMNKLTTDEDKSIAEDLSLNKLETYVNKVTAINPPPATSTARAATAKAGDFGGYSSHAEWAAKDPQGYQQSRTLGGSGVKIAYGNE